MRRRAKTGEPREKTPGTPASKDYYPFVLHSTYCNMTVFMITCPLAMYICLSCDFVACIRKTCSCNVYPLIPHFYIAKLGYAGVYLFFLFFLQNIDCGYSLEPPRRGGSNMYPQSMF